MIKKRKILIVSARLLQQIFLKLLELYAISKLKLNQTF